MRLAVSRGLPNWHFVRRLHRIPHRLFEKRRYLP
jgi:hypothetical protein